MRQLLVDKRHPLRPIQPRYSWLAAANHNVVHVGLLPGVSLSEQHLHGQDVNMAWKTRGTTVPDRMLVTEFPYREVHVLRLGEQQ